MANLQESDRLLLGELGQERLEELLLTHIRTLWSVDGLYYIGIEETHGTEEATRIDARSWAAIGKIEAKRMKAVLGITGVADLPTAFKALKLTVWALDLEDKQYDDVNFIMTNKKCRIQNTRKDKGLPEFPCRQVREGYLVNFFKEMNPAIKVICRACPPGPHKDVWCQWEFK